MLYEIKCSIVPTAKMRAALASWLYEDRIKATSTFKAYSIVLRSLKPMLKEDKNLRYAVKKGGLKISVAFLCKDVKQTDKLRKLKNK